MRESKLTKLNQSFLKRWSPRSFDNKKVSKEDILTVLEAARWAPSCFNEQPWRFIFATEEKEFDKFLQVLVPDNQTWARNAPVLIAAFAKKNFTQTDKPNAWAQFDAGAAWMALSLQARELGLYSHAMAGYSKDKAFEVCHIKPEDYDSVCMIALGHIGEKSQLPDKLQKMEAPNDRKALDSIAFENRYNG